MCSTQLHGQWQISGRLLDNEKNPLEAGIVVASVDTSFQILAHAVTNVAGYFELKILDSTLHTLYLQANYLGYSKQTVFIKKGDNSQLEISLSPSQQEINTVEILAEDIPIRQKNDTTVYNVSAFRDSTERNIEEVLKKIPGFQVKENGSITLNGKTVEKVLFEGDDVFGRKYDIGTKNIRAEMISKIEAIDNFQQNPLLNAVNNSESLVLNLKLENDQKNILSGVVTAGLGYGKNELKYNLNANFFLVSKAKKIIGISDSGNTGEQYNANEISAIYDELDDKSFTVPIWQLPEMTTQTTTTTLNLDNRMLDNSKNNFATIRSVFNTAKHLKISVNGFSFFSNDSQWSREQTTFLYNNAVFDRNTFSAQQISNKKYAFDGNLQYLSPNKNYSIEAYLKGNLDENKGNNAIQIYDKSTQFTAVNKRLRNYNVSNGILFTQKINNNTSLQLQEKTQLVYSPQEIGISGNYYGKYFYLDSSFTKINQKLNYNQRATELRFNLFHSSKTFGILQASGRYVNTFSQFKNLTDLADSIQQTNAHFYEDSNNPHHFFESSISVLKVFDKFQLRSSIINFYQNNYLPDTKNQTNFFKNISFITSLFRLFNDGSKLSGKVAYRKTPNTNIQFFDARYLKNEFEWHENIYPTNDANEYKFALKYEKSNLIKLSSFFVQSIIAIDSRFNTFNTLFNDNINIITPNLSGKKSSISINANFNYFLPKSKIIIDIQSLISKQQNNNFVQNVPVENNFYSVKLGLNVRRAFRFIIVSFENNVQQITAFQSAAPQEKEQIFQWSFKGSLVIRKNGWRLGSTFIHYKYFSNNTIANTYATSLKLTKLVMLFRKESMIELSVINLANKPTYESIINSNFFLSKNSVESIPLFFICKFDYQF
ncbi:MAG: hypothetical protein KA101_02945 [Saprospiraceae bacterium]|nr:hypothetical protein [Saprospiraceae bacterium]